jgi:hypothetical protein
VSATPTVLPAVQSHALLVLLLPPLLLLLLHLAS